MVARVVSRQKQQRERVRLNARIIISLFQLRLCRVV